MIELVLLIAIVAAVVLALRKRGGTDAPLIVQQHGRYHITFAPQLDSSRQDIEALAKRLVGDPHPAGDVPTRYFRMDRENDSYLLAVSFRKGIFFIQAIVPPPLTRDRAAHLAVLQEFSGTVMLHYPPEPPVDEAGGEKMDAVIDEVARQAGMVAVNLEA